MSSKIKNKRPLVIITSRVSNPVGCRTGFFDERNDGQFFVQLLAGFWQSSEENSLLREGALHQTYHTDVSESMCVQSQFYCFWPGKLLFKLGKESMHPFSVFDSFVAWLYKTKVAPNVRSFNAEGSHAKIRHCDIIFRKLAHLLQYLAYLNLHDLALMRKRAYEDILAITRALITPPFPP